MFESGTWVVESVARPGYRMDCTPEPLDKRRWCVQLVIYKKDGTVLRSLAPRALAFETADQAAEIARLFGEHYLAKVETS